MKVLWCAKKHVRRTTDVRKTDRRYYMVNSSHLGLEQVTGKIREREIKSEKANERYGSPDLLPNHLVEIRGSFRTKALLAITKQMHDSLLSMPSTDCEELKKSVKEKGPVSTSSNELVRNLLGLKGQSHGKKVGGSCNEVLT